MRNFFLLTLILCTGLSTISKAQEEDWITQYFWDANISLSVPDSMQYRLKETVGSVGTLQLHQYNLRYESQGKIIKFTFQFCDYPVGTIHHDSLELLELFFEATAEASASSVFGKVEYSAPIDWMTYPGMIWRVSFDKDRGLIKSKAFVRGNRYYNIKAEYPRSVSSDKSIDVFLDSFKWAAP